MIGGLQPEVLLAAGYAMFLGGIAATLELLARHSHRRSEQFELTGFTYHPEPDLWVCPTGQYLHKIELDHERRVARYRAPSHICNCCHIKVHCTDSDEGREIERRLNSWLDSEIRRFHRGISLALLLLAALILVAEVLRHRQPRELIVLWGLLAPVGVAGTRLLPRFLALGLTRS